MVDPIVLIAFGAKNEAITLPAFLEQIDGLDYPEDRLRYAAVTADSDDDTVDIILEWLKGKKDAYWRHFTPDLPLRRRMFTSTNYIRHYFTAVLPNVEPAEFMFHCDADVTKIPPETLRTLIELDVDIVAPYVYASPEQHIMNQFRGQKVFRDVWGYRFKYGPYPGLQFNSSVPEYYKRNMDSNKSIKADLDKRLIPMISVGANPILIKRRVLESMPWYDGLYATPGWCMEADKAGFGVWAYPDLECIHDWRR